MNFNSAVEFRVLYNLPFFLFQTLILIFLLVPISGLYPSSILISLALVFFLTSLNVIITMSEQILWAHSPNVLVLTLHISSATTTHYCQNILIVSLCCHSSSSSWFFAKKSKWSFKIISHLLSFLCFKLSSLIYFQGLRGLTWPVYSHNLHMLTSYISPSIQSPAGTLVPCCSHRALSFLSHHIPLLFLQIFTRTSECCVGPIQHFASTARVLGLCNMVASALFKSSLWASVTSAEMTFLIFYLK